MEQKHNSITDVEDNNVPPHLHKTHCCVPLIFLDIDGVFNCQIFYHSTQFKNYKEAKKQLRKDVKAERIERLDIITQVKFVKNV